MKYRNRNEIDEVINKYGDMLVRFAFYRVGSIADAEDIVQNVFIKFVERKIVFIKLGSIKSFLYTGVSNACIDFLRKNKTKLCSIDSIKNLESPENRDLTEEYLRIESLLKNLPLEQKEVVMLRIIDELEFKEISKILNIKVATAKSRYKYGINKLRTKIKTKEVFYEM